MTTPHKHADVIKAWADGKPIEWRYALNYPFPAPWQTWNQGDAGMVTPAFNSNAFLFRVKPNIIKYRRYLFTTSSNSVLVGLANDTANFDSLGVEHTWGPQFVRWIDTEWQEVEYD